MILIEKLKYGNTRCYLVNKKLMIDTDWAGTLNKLFSCLGNKDIILKEVEYLIITHYHPDHMGIAQELVDLGLKLIVLDVQRNFIHFSDTIFSKEKRSLFKPIVEEQLYYLSCSESRALMKKIGIEGEIIHTPGHSADSVSIILDNEAAIVGDLYPLELVKGYNDKILEES